MQLTMFDDHLNISPALLVQALADVDMPAAEPRIQPEPVITGKRLLTEAQLEVWHAIAFEYRILQFRGIHVPLPGDKMTSVRGRGCPGVAQMKALDKAGLIVLGMTTPEAFNYTLTETGIQSMPTLAQLRAKQNRALEEYGEPDF